MNLSGYITAFMELVGGYGFQESHLQNKDTHCFHPMENVK